MGLDNFASDSSLGIDDNEDVEEVDTTEDDSELTFDRDRYIERDYKHPSRDADVHSDYEEDYLSSCWYCGGKRVKLTMLHSLGNLWFCSNARCVQSIKYICEEVAAPKDLAQQINVDKAQRLINQSDPDPSEMNMEDFTGGNDKSTGNKRKFEAFTKDDFEDCLADTELEFERVDLEGTYEIVYEARSENDTFALRVYSTLDERTGSIRDKGSDAIRTVVVHRESGKPVIGEKRTNRIKTWRKNLKKKIRKIQNSSEGPTICDECGSVMVVRKNNKSGEEFLGCEGYPDCKNTESL